MLDKDILEQVKAVFAGLASTYTFSATYDPENEKAGELRSFLTDFCSCSDKLNLETNEAQGSGLQFEIIKDGQPTGIAFRAIPGGHEFTSLLLAVLNADGKGKNLPDEAVRRRIQAIKGPVALTTYMSLSCTNCPDVVQALDIIALLNPAVSHTIVDGGLWQDEVEKLGIQGVPTVMADGETLHVGRGDLGTLLAKIEEKYGAEQPESFEPIERSYDLLVAGGGPAGAAAAIYSARKGLKVAVVAGRIGGQVKDTVGIENLISVPKTTGQKLADDLKQHLGEYPIDIFENREIEKADLASGKTKTLYAKGGETFKAPAVVIATGASWRKLNVEGEAQYIGRGVAFCPHCDGPFYKGKHVAVIGGGNSGIEAAIDLAGICSKVTVLEFADTLRADTVLQDKAKSLPNVEIFTSRQTMRVIGDGKKVTAIEVKDRTNEQTTTIALDGIFVQIGLAANSKPFEGQLPMTPRKEIKTDEFCRTAVEGVYAAGDVTNVPYKQIIIAMGEGAKAALSAFDDRVRGII